MLFDFMKSQYGGKKAFLRYWYHAALNLLFGRYQQYGKMPKDIKRIVFVCKGNICRSAWAECYFRSLSSLPVCSIGLEAVSGNQAEKKIVDYAKKRGLDLNSHRTTSISDFKPMPHDLYVCMEPVHVGRLLSRLNLKQDGVVLLGMWFSKSVPYIHDPYSCNAEFTNRCLDLISVSVDNIQLIVTDKNEDRD